MVIVRFSIFCSLKSTSAAVTVNAAIDRKMISI